MLPRHRSSCKNFHSSSSLILEVSICLAQPHMWFLCLFLQGVGKTTLIMRVFETLKASNPNLKVQGFYTRMLSIPFSLLKLYELYV